MQTLSNITGLILAGGQGARMGGVDKGLQLFQGHPLALHTLQRLAPQTARVIINANRNLDTYAAMGVSVYADSLPDFAGPLAGFLTGLTHCDTPYLLTAPCDVPLLPLDLAQRLYAALNAAQAVIAMASAPEADGKLCTQPVFCLMHTSLRESLAGFLQAGGRKIDAWTAQHRCVSVPFSDALSFANVNTLAELQALEARPQAPSQPS